MQYGPNLCSIQGTAALTSCRAYALFLVKGDFQLSICAGSVYDSAMSDRAPLHAFEIIFYSTASVFAAVGLTWYFLH